MPKGLALEASSSKLKELEHHKRMLAQKREKVRREMQSTAEKLNQVTLTFSRKVVEEDKLTPTLLSPLNPPVIIILTS